MMQLLACIASLSLLAAEKLPPMLTFSFSASSEKVIPGNTACSNDDASNFPASAIFGDLAITKIPNQHNQQCYFSPKWTDINYKVEQGVLTGSDGRSFAAYKLHPAANLATSFQSNGNEVFFQGSSDGSVDIYAFNGAKFKHLSTKTAQANSFINTGIRADDGEILDKYGRIFVFDMTGATLSEWAHVAPGVEGASIQSTTDFELSALLFDVSGSGEPVDPLHDWTSRSWSNEEQRQVGNGPIGPDHWHSNYGTPKRFFDVTRSDGSEGVVWQDLTDMKVYMTWFGIGYCTSSTTQATPSSNMDHLVAAASDGASNIIIFQLGNPVTDEDAGTSFTAYKVDATTGAQTLTKVYDTSKNAMNIHGFHASGASIVWNTDADQVFMVLARYYTKASDGLNHQGETAFIFDASTLNLVKNWGQTASHCWANSALLASDGSYLTLALGDNFPRGIELNRFSGTSSAKSKLVYGFKTEHGKSATNPAGATYPEYTAISGGATTYYKWSNDNKVYTELGHRGVVEVSDGLLVFFSGESPALDNSQTSSTCNKDRNLGFVKWSKDVSSSTPLSSGATETGGFYTFTGSWSSQVNKGINFLTSHSSADCSSSVSRPKTAYIGNNIFLLWEIWTATSYVKTQAMVVDKDGTITQQTFDLSYDLRLPFTDDLITRYNSTEDITKVIAYAGSGGKLVRYEICSGASCSSKSQSGATCHHAYPTTTITTTSPVTTTVVTTTTTEAAYQCANQGCTWETEQFGVQWGYYSQSNGDCSACQAQCDADPTCGSVECNGGFCSWWKNGVCSDQSDFTSQFYTCVKQACQQWTSLPGEHLSGYSSAGQGCYSELAAKKLCLQTADCNGITKQHDECGGTQWTLRTGVHGLSASGFDSSNLESMLLNPACKAKSNLTTTTTPQVCADTANGAADSDDYTCAMYALGDCGKYDDSDFSANDMCCVCGGGMQATTIVATTTAQPTHGQVTTTAAPTTAQPTNGQVAPTIAATTIIATTVAQPTNGQATTTIGATATAATSVPQPTNGLATTTIGATTIAATIESTNGQAATTTGATTIAATITAESTNGQAATATGATTIVATTTPQPTNVPTAAATIVVYGTVNLLVESAASFMNDEVAQDGVKMGIAISAGVSKDWIILSISHLSRRLQSREDLSEDGRRLADAIQVSYEISVPASGDVTASTVQNNLASKQVSDLEATIKERIELAKGGSYNITVTAKSSVEQSVLTTTISNANDETGEASVMIVVIVSCVSLFFVLVMFSVRCLCKWRRPTPIANVHTPVHAEDIAKEPKNDVGEIGDMNDIESGNGESTREKEEIANLSEQSTEDNCASGHNLLESMGENVDNGIAQAPEVEEFESNKQAMQVAEHVYEKPSTSNKSCKIPIAQVLEVVDSVVLNIDQAPQTPKTPQIQTPHVATTPTTAVGSEVGKIPEVAEVLDPLV